MRMSILGIGILIAFVYFLFVGIIASWFSEAAREKGYSGAKYFWICFFFGVAGQLLVIALPDRGRGVGFPDEQPELLPDL